MLPLVEFVELGRALCEHLRTAFPKIGHAKLQNLTDLFGRGRFGDGDQGNVAHIPASLRARLGNALPHVVQIVRQLRFLSHALLLGAAIDFESPFLKAGIIGGMGCNGKCFRPCRLMFNV